MTSKEKKGFKRISKKFLSSFRREKKLHDISEANEDHSDKLNLTVGAKDNKVEVTELRQESLPSTDFERDSKRYATLTFSPRKSSKNHFKRILNRASFSNVRSIAKEHPDLLRNISLPRAGQHDLGGSRTASTDSGIDCSILVSETGSPEKFVAFTRREAERLRQEFLNETALETVTEVDSKSSLEDEGDETETTRVHNNVVNVAENEANESLEEQINQTKEHIEVLTELKTVLSGKLKEFDKVTSESPLLDEENYVVMTPPPGSAQRAGLNHAVYVQKSADKIINSPKVNKYSLDVYLNKTDETKARETRIRQGKKHLNIDHATEPKIVNPIPVVSANIVCHKALPATPTPASLFYNENSAFAKHKSVKRSVSDVGKGLFGKLINKKKDQSASFVSKDDYVATDHRKKHNKLKTKSLKKNKSFSFDGEHNISLDYLNSPEVNFKSIDAHTSILEDIDSFGPVVKNVGKETRKKSPVLKEILQVVSRNSPVQGSILDMTQGICEMTSALSASQGNSAESITCICDCKNRNSVEWCEHRKTPPVIDGVRKTNIVSESDTKIMERKDDCKQKGVKEQTTSLNFPDMLNKSIKYVEDDSESLYVNLDKEPRDNRCRIERAVNLNSSRIMENLMDSDSDVSECCDLCSQGCDCSHSDTECSDPNCPDHITEFRQRKKHGNISSSCDSLSENDECLLNKSLSHTYPNWVQSSDDQSTDSSSRSAHKKEISTSHRPPEDESSPEPIRITKFDSSPNSISSFNMESSFSVSFHEVDFGHGEVMYKLDDINKSITSVDPVESPYMRKIHHDKRYQYSCTPSSPSISHNVSTNFNNCSQEVREKCDRKKKKKQTVPGSDPVNFLPPLNLSFSQKCGMSGQADDAYVALTKHESPLNLSSFDLKYSRSQRTDVNRGYGYVDKIKGKASRNGYGSNLKFAKGQTMRDSLLSRSLNESHILQQNGLSGTNVSKKPLRYNQSLHDSMMLFSDERYCPVGSSSPFRYQGRNRLGPTRDQMSRSFSEAVDLNQTGLNESCLLDSSMYDVCNSPLDLSVSKPRYHKDLSPKPLDLSVSRVTSPVNRMHKQAKWVNRHVGQIYSPAKRVLHKNRGLSEKDLCKQILDLYVSDVDEPDFGDPSMLDTTMDSSVMTEDSGGIVAEDSILQYGTYLAPRHVVKETNIDDFTTTVRTCYTGEAKTRKLPGL